MSVRSRALAAAALCGVLLLPGCAMFEPRETNPAPVNNLESARVFSAGGRVLDPEEAKKLRTQSVIDPTTVEEHDDVVTIQQFFNPSPWILDAAGQPCGFRVPIYFVSGQTEKGAFVPGTILCWLYLVDPTAPASPSSRQPLYIWELGRNDAMGFRVRKKSLMGYPYMFILKWPDSLVLGGETIEIEFGYERLDKRVVLGAPQRFRVPPPPRGAGRDMVRRQPRTYDVGAPAAPAETPAGTRDVRGTADADPAQPQAVTRTMSPEQLAELRRQVSRSGAPADDSGPAPERTQPPRAAGRGD